jgi:hypothetical protein
MAPGSKLYVVILQIQAGRAVAIFATLTAAAAILSGSASAAAGTPRSSGSGPTGLTAARQFGGLAGRVVDSRGRALAGACVTASPATVRRPSERASQTVVTSADGMFMVSGLPAGAYLLRYRNCLTSASTLIPWVTSSAAYVTGGRTTMLGPVTVRPRAGGPAAEMPDRRALTRLTAAQLRRHVKRQDLGGIAGTVLGPHGRHIKGLCFTVYSGGGGFGISIPADGRYSTGKTLPPGKYKVGFDAVSCSPFGTASGNWAPEWYRGKFTLSAADTVVVKAGKITRGIGAVMRPGAVISGTVTGHAGHALRGVCVIAATPHGSFVQQVITRRNGRYQFRGLDPGRYGIDFSPNCGRESVYLPQWWPGTANETRRGLVKTGFGTTTRHIDARLVVGGTISGVVRFKNRHGQPIKGICVNATPASQPFSFGYPVGTNAKGKYAFRGLPAGSYSLSFGPGCNNDGNYLDQNYPHNVTARLGHVTGGINAYLQPGAIITGTVTARASGAKLGGICVLTASGFAGTETHANGRYSMDRIPPGRTKVEFINCDNRGNFAPQFYPDNLNVAAAVSIGTRAGRITSGIDAALAPGATISGTIALPSDRTPSGVCALAVPVQFATGFGGNLAFSRQGQYTLKDLAPGDYRIEYGSCGGPDVADAWFRAPGRVSASEANAEEIFVSAGGSVPGIDAVVQIGGDISGFIHAPASQRGTFVCANISHSRSAVPSGAFFGLEIGYYTFLGLDPGKYFVEFFACGGENLASQWYRLASRPAKATPVLVRAGRTTSKVDAWMALGGSITGRVLSKATGRPLRAVCVFASSVNQPFFGYGRTDRSGHYTVRGLNSGTYRLDVSSCGSSNLVPLVTGRVRAVQGKAVAAPQVAMQTYRGGAISGRVTAVGSPRRPAIGACVEAFPLSRGAAGQLEEGSGAAGPRGYYRITNLIPGEYKVFVDPGCDAGGLVPQWYKGASRRSKATVVAVAAGQRTRSISVTVQPYGSISGTVTGPNPADKPLAGICVQAVPVRAGATPLLTESTAPRGGYQTGPLPPGKYLVKFEAGCAARGYKTQWWQESASMIYATPVTVRPGLTRSGIDAHMTQGSRKEST